MGLEYITQPQVFLGGLTALGPGIQGLTENYPLLTTYNSWTSTAPINATVFPIPGVWSIYNGLNNSGSFIISVGGVVQSPLNYTIDIFNRTITFTTPVVSGVEVAGTQLATAAPSSQEFSYIKVLTGDFTNSTFQNVTATNLTVLSSALFNTTIFTFTTADALTANEALINTNLTAVGTVFTASGNSDQWNETYSFVQTSSSSWEESADILPTVTNYLSTELVSVSTLNVTEQMLSANTDLFNIFLTPANTLTTSICAMSGDGVTPFLMNFTNGLLTSLTV